MAGNNKSSDLFFKKNITSYTRLMRAVQIINVICVPTKNRELGDFFKIFPITLKVRKP